MRMILKKENKAARNRKKLKNKKQKMHNFLKRKKNIHLSESCADQGAEMWVFCSSILQWDCPDGCGGGCVWDSCEVLEGQQGHSSMERPLSALCLQSPHLTVRSSLDLPHRGRTRSNGHSGCPGWGEQSISVFASLTFTATADYFKWLISNSDCLQEDQCKNINETTARITQIYRYNI